MKRDPDLVRKLLPYLEEKPDDELVGDLELEGYSKQEVHYHFVLLDEAGLLRCERQTRSAASNVVTRVNPVSLTWQGHEFLEAARNDASWQKAKETVISKTGALSMDLLKAVLFDWARKGLGV